MTRCVSSWAMGVILCLIGTPTFAADTAATTAPAVIPPNPELLKQLTRKIPELHFNQNALQDVIDYLRDVTGANVCVDWNALKAAGVDPKFPVTYAAKDQSFDQSLDAILSNVGALEPIDFKVIGDLIEISTESGIKRLEAEDAVDVAATAGPVLAKVLREHLPELHFNANGFADVVDFLRDVTSTNIYVDWPSLEKNGVKRDTPISARFRDISFQQALRHILDEAYAGDVKMAAKVGKSDSDPVDFKVVGDVIAISTESGIKRLEAGEAVDVSATAGPKLAAILRKRLPELHFNANGFADVVDFLRDVTGANIYVDWPAFEKNGVPRDTPISARLRDIPFQQALQLVCYQACSGDVMMVAKVERDTVIKNPHYPSSKGDILIITIADAPATGPSH
jgi:hypothetical protein